MKHILIVDDDIHINKMLDEVLVHERYMVSHAYSGTEALLFLADTKPDLILLDLMLPGFAGTIQAFVPNDIVDIYKKNMEDIFGEDACHVLKIRKYGGMKVL